jgi:bleomycin hydrolase
MESRVRWLSGFHYRNSWGDENGDKGYFCMTDDWFDEYMYQVVIEKSLLPSNITDILKQDPVSF